MAEETDEQWVARTARANGYPFSKVVGNDRWVFVHPKIYTWAVGIAEIGNEFGMENYWCFHDPAQAVKAFTEWDGTGEPEGWFRNPPTGRRLAETANEHDEHGQVVPIGAIYTRH